jgi:hypothetical protein
MQILTATSARLAEIIRCRDGPRAAPRQAQKPDSCGPQTLPGLPNAASMPQVTLRGHPRIPSAVAFSLFAMRADHCGMSIET